jgi:hypothetical protein
MSEIGTSRRLEDSLGGPSQASLPALPAIPAISAIPAAVGGSQRCRGNCDSDETEMHHERTRRRQQKVSGHISYLYEPCQFFGVRKERPRTLEQQISTIVGMSAISHIDNVGETTGKILLTEIAVIEPSKIGSAT